MGGALGASRVLVAVEEHGRGRQVLRFRVRPRVPRLLGPALVALVVTSAAAAHAGAWPAAAVLVPVAVAAAVAAVAECGMATAAALRAIADEGVAA